MDKENLTTNEAAALLGVARTSIINWTKQGKLQEALTPGGHRRFNKEDLIEFAHSHGLNSKIKRDRKKTPAKPPRNKRILVVDDDDDFRLFANETLGVAGKFDIKEASNGIEAALITGSWKPDLILLDLNMPKMNGIDFIKQMRNTPGFNSITIIILTAFADENTQAELKPYEIRDLIVKPIGIKDFVEKIRSYT